MIKRIKKSIPIIFLSLLIGCTTTPKNKTTYFGGKIINPKSNYLILYHQEKAIDTFFLDKKNTFLKKITLKTEGLYYFKHGIEYQFLYLVPQDSLLFRLNTWDFDGSLVFSGKGAARNNILIDCFLDSEKDSKQFYKHFQLSPLKIKQKIDSIKLIKLTKYHSFIDRNPNESNSFKDILTIALTYPLYSKLEQYILSHKRCKKKHALDLSKISSFYEHRKHININRDSLMYFFAYSNYVTNYLYNLSYKKTHNFSSEFIKNLLYIIDKNIVSEKTKNELLKQTIISHFYNQSSCKNYEKVFFTFFKLNTNIKHKKKVQQLLNDTKLVKSGEKMSNFLFTDFNNNKHSINNTIKGKASSLLFWNPKNMSTGYLASRIKFLSSKYPKIQFIQIKIDGTLHDKINKLDIKTQFFIDSLSNANTFLSSKFSRTILVDKKGIITNGFASLYSRKIHQQLEKLQKE